MGPTLHFMGHYNEPPVELRAALLPSSSSSSSSVTAQDFLLSFDPIALKWSLVQNPEDEPLLKAEEYLSLEAVRERRIEKKPDHRIGKSHRAYCVNGVMKSRGLSQKVSGEQGEGCRWCRRTGENGRPLGLRRLRRRSGR